MKYREVASKLTSLGCHEISRKGGGSHRKWQNLNNQQSTVIPDWGGKDLKIGTVRAAVRQLGIDWENFRMLDSRFFRRVVPAFEMATYYSRWQHFTLKCLPQRKSFYRTIRSCENTVLPTGT